MRKKKKIAVVGAGISGLTCAYELQKLGHTVVVFEKEHWVGGRMSSRVKDGFIFDIGANHLINLYSAMQSYCREFNIPWQKFPFVKYKIYHRGKLKNIFGVLGAMEKMRLARTYKTIKDVPMSFLDCTTLADFDTEDAYTFAKKYIGQSFADNIVDTYTGVYQFHGADEISSAALLSQLNSIKNQNADWCLYRTPGGMITLPEAFAKRLPLKTDTEVTHVTSTPDGVRITINQTTEVYDAAVLASTATIANRIYQNPTQAERSVLEATRYASSILVAFLVPHDLLGETTGDTSRTISAVWIPPSESHLLSSYSNEAYKGEELVKAGKTLLLAFFRTESAKEFIKKTDEAIYAITKKEMMKVCPMLTNEAMLEPHDIYRWAEAMPIFYAGFLKKVKTFLDTEQGANHVWFCGDYLNSPWTEGALRCGARVAARMGEIYA